MSATVPPIIYHVQLQCRYMKQLQNCVATVRPTLYACALVHYLYIIYREITTAIPRIKMLAVNTF